jgi:hypothetical protein
MSRRILIAAAAVAVLASACGGLSAPSSVTVENGNAASGSVPVSLRYDDNDYFTVGATCNGYFGGCTAEWTATFQTDMPTVAEPLVRYVGKNAGAGFQFITVFNWRTWSWYPIDAFHVVATSEVAVDKALPGPASDWLLKRGSDLYIGVVRVATIGNFTSTAADVLLGCVTTCDWRR